MIASTNYLKNFSDLIFPSMLERNSFRNIKGRIASYGCQENMAQDIVFSPAAHGMAEETSSKN